VPLFVHFQISLVRETATQSARHAMEAVDVLSPGVSDRVEQLIVTKSYPG
jgi:hypothetical protein